MAFISFVNLKRRFFNISCHMTLNCTAFVFLLSPHSSLSISQLFVVVVVVVDVNEKFVNTENYHYFCLFSTHYYCYY
jgi:hypothetical protein